MYMYMCVYIYIYIYMTYMAVSTLFVTMASTETLNGTISCVTLFPPLPVPKVTQNRTV